MSNVPATIPKLWEFPVERDDIGKEEIAVDVLRKLAKGITLFERARVYYRWLLGLQLVYMRNRPWLWTKDIPEDKPKTWHYWMHFRFKEIIGLSHQIGYNAIAMAESSVVERIGDEGLKSWPSLTNLNTLIKLEREGESVTPEMVEEARTQPVVKFNADHGIDKDRYHAHITVSSPETARAISHLGDLFARAHVDSIEEFVRFSEDEALPLVGNSLDSLVDLYLAGARSEMADLEAQHREAQKVVDVDWSDLEDEPVKNLDGEE